MEAFHCTSLNLQILYTVNFDYGQRNPNCKIGQSNHTYLKIDVILAFMTLQSNDDSRS